MIARLAGAGRGARALRRGAALAAALSALPAVAALAQSDPRLVAAVRRAQEGSGDSARAEVRRLLAATPPSDSLYPELLYTSAMIADDAGEMRRQLQRVAVEHAASGWADDALLRLAQMDFATRDYAGATRNLERLRLDHPLTPLLPQAAHWAARSYFEMKNPSRACRWLKEGLARASDDIELQNQLGFHYQRCAGVATADTAARVAGAGADSARPDTPPRPATPALASGDTVRPRPDSARQPAPHPRRPDTTRAAATPPAPVPVPKPNIDPAPATRRPVEVPPGEPAPRPAAPAPGAAPPAPGSARAPRGSVFRVQVAAATNPATAESVARRARALGLEPVTIREGGFYKVRVGPYPSRAAALAAVPNLKARLGGSPFVVAGP